MKVKKLFVIIAVMLTLTMVFTPVTQVQAYSGACSALEARAVTNSGHTAWDYARCVFEDPWTAFNLFMNHW